MKITAVIIDDDADSRLVLRSYLSTEHPEIIIVGESDSVIAGIEIIQSLKPDLLLLDISLPDGTAFDLLEKLPGMEAEIIFVTAHNTFAIQAFKLAAIDYLLKPVSFTELDQAIHKLENRVEEKYFIRHWKTLVYNSKQKNPYDQRLAIATTEGFLFVELKEIMRLESKSNYTHFYFRNKTKLISSRTLGYYEEILPKENFIRIHHSYIVNAGHVEKYIRSGAGGILVMSDGTELPVSQRKKNDTLDYFLKLRGFEE